MLPRGHVWNYLSLGRDALKEHFALGTTKNEAEDDEYDEGRIRKCLCDIKDDIKEPYHKSLILKS